MYYSLLCALIILSPSAYAMQPPVKVYDQEKTNELKTLLNMYVPSDGLPEAKVRKLILENADPNITAESGFYEGCTWFHSLIPEPCILAGDRSSLILFLIEKGANPSLRDNQKQTVLLRAIVKASYFYALKVYKYTSDSNLPDENGNNLLHHLVYRGEVEKLKIWLGIGRMETDKDKSILKSLKEPNNAGKIPMDIVPVKDVDSVKELLMQYQPQKNF